MLYHWKALIRLTYLCREVTSKENEYEFHIKTIFVNYGISQDSNGNDLPHFYLLCKAYWNSGNFRIITS